MDYINISFGKDKTAIIKGFAVVFMIFLHVFGGEGWYENDIPMNHNEGLIRFMHSFQICVGIFVFMIGYGYAYSKKKDLCYSIKHVKQLLTVFWTILFIFAVPASLNVLSSENGYKILLLNMFGIDETLLWVSWFVFLYIWSMIIMPFAGRVIDRKPYFGFIVLTLFSIFAQVAIWRFVNNFNFLPGWHMIFVCFSWTPTILLGYLFARKDLFCQIKLPKHYFMPIISLSIVAIILWLKMVMPGIKILNFDIIYAPIIILCILAIFSQCRVTWLSGIFSELGDKSVYMWFVHALFFTAATRPVYHKFVMISDNLWIVAIWTILLSYIVSYVLKKIVEI